MDRGAWQATVHGVAKSQTQLSVSLSLSLSLSLSHTHTHTHDFKDMYVFHHCILSNQQIELVHRRHLVYVHQRYAMVRSGYSES